jgi:hypothetical protein
MVMMYANPNTVYQDDRGQYTTNGFNPYERNYFNLQQQQQQAPQTPSPLNDLLAKAMAARANAPTINQLFSSMGNQGILGSTVAPNGAYQMPFNFGSQLANPSYGAGRFLGGNSMSSGMTSNAMNTTM